MKLDNNILVVLIIGGILLYMGSQGMFKSELQSVTNTETIKILENQEISIDGETCSLSVDKNNVDVGDIVKGTIKDGVQKECNVYYKLNEGVWIWHQKVNTDIDGVFVGNQIMPGEGNYEFKAICDGCVTNSITIIVNPIIVEEEKDSTPKCFESDGGANPSVYSTCYDSTMGKMVEFLMKKDTCVDTKGPLTEWYCESGICKSKLMECRLGDICSDGYCHPLLCSDIKDPISQRDCDKAYCRGACSYVYNSKTDTDSCECVSKCNVRYAELGYQYYYYYDGTYPPDSRECSAKANHECGLLGKENPLWLNEPYGMYGEQLEGRCCMWVCV